MRALTTTLLLLALAAPAAAKPLDADRGFARAGVLRMNEPIASRAVLRLPDGGTLHATEGAGLLRLSSRGRRLSAAPLAGVPRDIITVRGGGLVLGTQSVEYDKPTPVTTWKVRHDGDLVNTATIPLPRNLSAFPVRLAKRSAGAFALVQTTHMATERRGLMIVALTSDGELDQGWGDEGFRPMAAGSAGVGVARDGSMVVARALPTRCDRVGFTNRKERMKLRIERLSPRGRRLASRTMKVGAQDECPANSVGDVLVDSRGRTTVAGGFGTNPHLLRLRRDFTRDRRFGRRGVVTIPVEELWTPVRLEWLPGRRYAFGLTEGRDSTPRATVGMVDAGGRNLRRRRLKVSRNHPHSSLDDIAIDRNRGIVAAGSLYDTDVYIREDYGSPHLAVWRVRTR